MLRDIQSDVQEIYRANGSPTLICKFYRKSDEIGTQWQARSLQKVHPMILFEALDYYDEIVSKASYTYLGIDVEDQKDLLGIWMGNTEAVKFWLKVCTKLQNRGVHDVFTACINGLKALPNAIRMVFFQLEMQLCIIHMTRNSIKYVPHSCSKEFMADVKEIDQASIEEIAYQQLEKMQKKWESKYILAIRPWFIHWDNIKIFFAFPEQIRRIISTTHAAEFVYRQCRKTPKNKAVFLTNESMVKMFFLTIRDLSKKWTMPMSRRETIISHLPFAYYTKNRQFLLKKFIDLFLTLEFII